MYIIGNLLTILVITSLKEALLRRFMVTEEGFREKLRRAKPERGESFGQFMTRLEGYFNRWIELGHVDKTYQGLKDALLRQQAMSVVTRNLRIFIMERKPKDIGEMSILAEQYLEVHGNTYNFANVDINTDRIWQDNNRVSTQTGVPLAWIDGQAVKRRILA